VAGRVDVVRDTVWTTKRGAQVGHCIVLVDERVRRAVTRQRRSAHDEQRRLLPRDAVGVTLCTAERAEVLFGIKVHGVRRAVCKL
jgi:hypothetical protein